MTARIRGLCGLALAGGGSRRMGGGDKPLLEAGGRPMLAHVLDALAAEAEAVAISANGDPARFAAFGVPVLDDGRFAGRGPLAGVLAGLDWAAARGAEMLLTLPGDTPLVPHGVATSLAPPPACAASRGQAHYLVALWPVSAREQLRTALRGSRADGVSAHEFAASIGMREVGFPAAEIDLFLNVNTPDELALVRGILR